MVRRDRRPLDAADDEVDEATTTRDFLSLLFWLAIGAFGVFVLISDYRIDAVRLRGLSTGQSDPVAAFVLATSIWASVIWGRRPMAALRRRWGLTRTRR